MYTSVYIAIDKLEAFEMSGQIVKRGERAWLVRVSRGRDASGRGAT
jgi:hypothetical protein